MESVEMSLLASMMLAWERTQLQADQLRIKIERTVLRIGKTQTVGNVRATYSGGRKTCDYHEAAERHPTISYAAIELFTVTPEPQTDWREVCDHIGVDKADIPFTQTEPSVTMKLLK